MAEVFKASAGDNPRKDELLTSAGEISNADSQGSLEKDLATVKDELIESLWEKLDTDSNKILVGSIPCIYSVPEKLRTKKKSDYSPHVISIGPHYYEHNKLPEDMEVHKTKYMLCLFNRTVAPSLSLDRAVIEKDAKQKMKECVDAIRNTVAIARSSYASSFTQYSDDKFTEIMIVDGCFILEFLYRFNLRMQDRVNFQATDPFLGNFSVLNDVKRDLLLLENQIPFFVLEILFKVTLMQIQNPPPQLTHLILQLFRNVCFECKNYPCYDYVTHILGFIHMCHMPNHPVPDVYDTKFDMTNYSATDLHRAGVNFMVSKGDNTIDVEFNTSCWFDRLCGQRTPSKIPPFCVFMPNRLCCFVSRFCQLFGKTRLAITPLCIYDETESFLRNFIAYEQCYPFAGSHITSYAFLIDTLINDEEDVQLLERKGVLRNYLGAPRDAVDLFNNLCKEVVLEPFLFMKQWKQVVEYRRRIWQSHIALMKRTYFNTPWSGIAFVVGLFLTICQIIQTFKLFG